MEDPYQNKNSFEFHFRLRRFRHIRNIISSILQEKERCRILDVGGTENYWKLGDDLFREGRIEIDLLNLSEVPVEIAHFRSIAGNATEMSCFPDHSYDFVHSNSVIEHVGDWNNMTAMAQNIRRLAPNYFVQVPYFWFPLEPHFRVPFFHWLPEQIRYPILMKRNLGFHSKKVDLGNAMETIQSARLLDRKQFACLFPEAEIIPEKIGFLTKSLMAVYHQTGLG